MNQLPLGNGAYESEINSIAKERDALAARAEIAERLKADLVAERDLFAARLAAVTADRDRLREAMEKLTTAFGYAANELAREALSQSKKNDRTGRASANPVEQVQETRIDY